MVLSDGSRYYFFQRWPTANGKGDGRLQIKQKDKEFVDHLHDIFQPLGIVGSALRSSLNS
jgi:hypothetical protein